MPLHPKARLTHMAKEDTDDDTADPPSIGDRVEASDDFTAALEQSVGLVKANRKLLILLVIASLAFLLWVTYPYLAALVG